MKTPRIIAAIAVSLLTLSATGCGYLNPDTATGTWSRSGVGVNIEGVGPLAVRNVLVVATEDGASGNLIAAIVNTDDAPHVLTLEIGEDSPAELTIPVPAETTVSFGQRDTLDDPPLIENLDAAPGSMVPIYFQAGDAPGILRSVPVLDACLPYLNGLEPGTKQDECPVVDNELG